MFPERFRILAEAFTVWYMQYKNKIYYVDAGTRANGTEKQDSIAVVTDQGGLVLVEEHIGFMTNNEAEYTALNLCLLYLAQNRIKNVTILSDSRLIVEQVNMNWKVKSSHLLQYRDAAINMNKQVVAMLKWVPREYNMAGHYIEESYGI